MFMVFQTMLITEEKKLTFFMNVICKFVYERRVKVCGTFDTMNGHNT
jgi:hypothetical protein